MSRSCIHLTIHGRVQGVGYRAWMAGTARRLSLTGWVRNRSDGTVEAMICGEDGPLFTMQRECRKGPLAAKVTHVDAKDWNGAPPTQCEQLPTV